MYDYLIVGAGLFGAVFAHEANKKGKKCLVIDKRTHIGGNIYTENVEGIAVHRYGAHIFHTSNREVWEYVQQFAEFNRYTNSPVANFHGEIYSMPFNMYTFNKMWGVVTPSEAREKIEEQKKECHIENPKNLEEQAITLVGKDIYEKLVKGYTQKQWGRLCSNLPQSIIQRLPLRFTYDNRYFDDRYQGIPLEGYDSLVSKLLEGADVLLNTDDRDYIAAYPDAAEKTVFTGRIDEYYDYSEGVLEYRSLRFVHEEIAQPDYQGNAVINYTAADIPYTRIIEHKHFIGGSQQNTVVTREYPQEWEEGMEPFYPICDEKNTALYQKYLEKARTEPNVIFGGRLGAYRYCNMDEVILSALQAADLELFS